MVVLVLVLVSGDVPCAADLLAGVADTTNAVTSLQ
jgi:hypothetical protein